MPDEHEGQRNVNHTYRKRRQKKEKEKQENQHQSSPSIDTIEPQQVLSTDRFINRYTDNKREPRQRHLMTTKRGKGEKGKRTYIKPQLLAL